MTGCPELREIYLYAALGIIGAGLLFCLAIVMFMAAVTLYDRVRDALHHTSGR